MMREHIFPDVGRQEVLAGTQGLDGTQEYPHVFTAKGWGQALQEHPLDMGVFFVREERDIPGDDRDSDHRLQAMRLPIMGSSWFRQGENGFRNFDGRTCLRRRGSEPVCTWCTLLPLRRFFRVLWLTLSRHRAPPPTGALSLPLQGRTSIPLMAEQAAHPPKSPECPERPWSSA